jgi:hypothetical protein
MIENIRMDSIPENVVNKDLYRKIKSKIKKRMKWPSAYASGQLVKQYKAAGGKYKGKKPAKNTGLQRWYKEHWIDVCYWPKKVRCGRKTAGKTRKYPYCRPSKKISSKTPKTVQSLSKAERERRCKLKRKRPSKKIK